MFKYCYLYLIFFFKGAHSCVMIQKTQILFCLVSENRVSRSYLQVEDLLKWPPRNRSQCSVQAYQLHGTQAWCKKTSLISRTEMFSWKILDYTGAGCSHLAPSRRPILCLKPTKISAIPVVWTPRALGTTHPRLRQHCSATLKSALSLCTVITSSQNLPYQQPTARSNTSFKNQLIFHKLLNASGALKRFD